MAKGGTSKDKVFDALKAAFKEDWIGFDDKKRGVIEFIEDGERIQICVALTCPKTLIERNGDSSPAITKPSSDAGAFVTAADVKKNEFSTEERKTVDTLLKDLDIDISKF